MTFAIPTVIATAPRIPYLPYAPKLPTPCPALTNIQATSDQFTNLKLLYRRVQTLDQQIDPMEKNIDFILSQLSPEEQFLLSGDFEALRQKQKLLQSVTNKIVQNEKYSLTDHSCSGEIISSFAELGINIVDPRWTVGDIYAPADIDNFLKHSKQVIHINPYPKT